MGDDLFEQLADALNRLPNAFPRTPSNVEIQLLKKIFTTEEAKLAVILSGRMEPVEDIARRIGLSVDEVQTKYMNMVRRGLVWFRREKGSVQFRLAPFLVGIYEAQLNDMDHELAHLVEEYMISGGAAGIMKPLPAIHRVVPSQGTVKSEWILPYEDVRALLEAGKIFQVRDCICRIHQDILKKRKCDFPLNNCLSFSVYERPARPGDISREEALRILDETEQVGLVHTVSNVMKGVNYMCNCCGCCCGILRAITEFGIENSVAAANYYALIDDEVCQACGACQERCQVNAIKETEGQYSVIKNKCIGCGLCVTGCPHSAVVLQRKPESEIVHPPTDFAQWEQERLRNRGLEFDNNIQH